MAYETVLGGNVPIKAWTEGVKFEEHAKAQLRYVAMLPIIFRHVAVMPDVTPERGSTVGSVIPTLKAVIPAAVGVDIGCGMMAWRTSLTSHQVSDNAQELYDAILDAVPVPTDDRKDRRKHGEGSWEEVPKDVAEIWAGMNPDWRKIVGRHGRASAKDVHKQLGTLGGGNHFIEVCIDEEDRVWFMLHSGSRKAGNAIGTYFIELARKDMMRQNIRLPNQDLAYFSEGAEHFDEYVFAVKWAQNYAAVNREIMMNNIVKQIRKKLGVKFMMDEEAVNCHHNYVEKETHFGQEVYVTRKGAVSARLGQLGIVPGSMGTESFIVRGLGNEESFQSCAHGAGRTMPRGEAGQRITLEQHRRDTEGIVCRKDRGVVDESPSAYKEINAVMNAQRDLVEKVHTLKQIVCIKG
jgi:tRNA-splicing ligase RtcB